MSTNHFVNLKGCRIADAFLFLKSKAMGDRVPLAFPSSFPPHTQTYLPSVSLLLPPPPILPSSSILIMQLFSYSLSGGLP